MRRFSDPFDTLLQLQRALSRVGDDNFFGLSTFNRGEFPGINVFRSQDGFLLKAELPGLRKDEIQIEVTGDIIRISGERKPSIDRSEVSVHRSERKFGKFDRSLKLPAHVDGNGVQAQYTDGVLNVRLPLAESEKPRQITVG